MSVQVPIDLNSVVTYDEFGALVGITNPAVAALVRRGVLRRDATVGEWIRVYCGRLRETAAGRSAEGGLNLSQERARLAREQADIAALKKGQMEKQLAPVGTITLVLSRVSAQLSGILDRIPVTLKRKHPELEAKVLEVVTEAIIEARNTAADLEINLADLVDPTIEGVRAAAALPVPVKASNNGYETAAD